MINHDIFRHAAKQILTQYNEFRKLLASQSADTKGIDYAINKLLYFLECTDSEIKEDQLAYIELKTCAKVDKLKTTANSLEAMTYRTAYYERKLGDTLTELGQWEPLANLVSAEFEKFMNASNAVTPDDFEPLTECSQTTPPAGITRSNHEDADSGPLFKR